MNQKPNNTFKIIIGAIIVGSIIFLILPGFFIIQSLSNKNTPDSSEPPLAKIINSFGQKATLIPSVNNVPRVYSELTKFQNPQNKSTFDLEIKIENKLIENKYYGVNYISTLNTAPLENREDSNRPKRTFGQYLDDMKRDVTLEDGGFNGHRCPNPAVNKFKVREKYLLEKMELVVETDVSVEKIYFGFPTSQECYFHYYTNGSRLIKEDQVLVECKTLEKSAYNNNGYIEIFGGKKYSENDFGFEYKCFNTVTVGRNLDSEKRDSHILQFTNDNGKTFQKISDFDKQINISSYKFPGVENYTPQQLNDPDKEYYNKLLSAENFFGRQYKFWDGQKSFYHIKTINSQNQYNVVTLQTNSPDCVDKTIQSNSFLRDCDKQLYFIKEDKFDVIKTLQELKDIPIELSEMKTKGWDKDVAKKIITQR